ncbi:MAG: NADH-quinone oxidoreductase subunit N [Bdellovibrionota bacterium]
MSWTQNNVASFLQFWPESLLGLSSMVCLLGSAFAKNKKIFWQFLCALTLLVYGAHSAISLVACSSSAKVLFLGHLRVDGLSYLLQVIFALISLVTLHLSTTHRPSSEHSYTDELPAFLLVLTLGMAMMVSSNSLLMLFLSVEMVSIPSYILVGMKRSDVGSGEAGLKYLLFGAFASGLMLFGISFLFGAVGSVDFSYVAGFLQNTVFDVQTKIFLGVSMIFLIAGLGYKMAIFPSHMWCPDVYQAAPTPITTFLSVGPKVAGFALLIRILSLYVSPVPTPWTLSVQALLSVLAAVTMTIGNVGALAQIKMKRLIAYSSIAHAGYILMGLSALNLDGLQAAVFYFVVYFFMNAGVFYITVWMENHYGSDEIHHFKALAEHSPILMAVMAIFLFSLVGLPPFAGFLGKFYLFAAVVREKLYILAIIGAINTAISLYYYAKILKIAYFSQTPLNQEDQSETLSVGKPNLSMAVMTFLLAFPVTFLILKWKPLLTVVELATKSILF